MQIRLCDEDRKAFGVDEEWLDFDLVDISVDDLDLLAERYNFDPMDWPTPFLGELTFEQAGDENATPKPPRWQSRVAPWMLLRQAGKDVSLEDAGKVRWFKRRQREGPGKEIPDPSPDSEVSTTPPSASSSTSPRKRSAG